MELDKVAAQVAGGAVAAAIMVWTAVRFTSGYVARLFTRIDTVEQEVKSLQAHAVSMSRAFTDHTMVSEPLMREFIEFKATTNARYDAIMASLAEIKHDGEQQNNKLDRLVERRAATQRPTDG